MTDRLLLITYPKSGTHQIMPIFSDRMLHVIDRSNLGYANFPARYVCVRDAGGPGIADTVNELRTFKDKAFGHIRYLPEYYDAAMAMPTKIIFNVRDPRDIVVAEYENILHLKKTADVGWLNIIDGKTNKRIMDTDDPIAHLIYIAGGRWRQWLGWAKQENVLVIKYRELRGEPRIACEKIIEFLGGTHCTHIDTMIKRSYPNDRTPTFRKGLVGEWQERFTEKHKRLARLCLREAIETLGYEL